MQEAEIKGNVAEGFDEVRSVFKENFKKRGELGASCCAFYKGQKIVDLWGGYSKLEKKENWEEDTIAPVYSTVKGISALTLAHAHSRGLFDYEKKMSIYWPEFSQNGKEDITIKQLMSHQAGLCVIDEPIPFERLGDPDFICKVIEKQKPAWIPGTKHGYHTVSLGWYQNELIRRVDPKKRSLSQYFEEEIAKQLNLDLYIGLPETIPNSRIATIERITFSQILTNLFDIPWAFVLAFRNKKSLTYKSFKNPEILGNPLNYNKRELQIIGIPSTNGFGNARSIAALYSEFAMGGKNLGIDEHTIALLESDAIEPIDGILDQILKVYNNYAYGFSKPHKAFNFGSSKNAYGTPGTGGSFGFADPNLKLGYAYVMNKCGLKLWNDPRELALRQSIYNCIKNNS